MKDSAITHEVRRIVQAGIKSGGVRRAGERLAASEDQDADVVVDWIYDQHEGKGAGPYTVTALAALLPECPTPVRERVRTVLFDERGGAAGSPDLVAGIGRVTEESGRLIAALGEALRNHRIDPEDKPRLRRHLLNVNRQAAEALQRFDQEDAS